MRESGAMIVDIVRDQQAIWTSPFRSRRRDVPSWLAFAAGTGVLIALDRRIESVLPKHGNQTTIGKVASQVGRLYSLVPVVALFDWAGEATGNAQLRDAGRIGLRAIIDSEIVAQILKLATQRPRPDESRGRGQFWKGGNSFPSAHSIKCWALAAVLSEEFADTKFVPMVAYGWAAAVSVARFAARRHFASDALAGAAMGWFIGRYVRGG